MTTQLIIKSFVYMTQEFIERIEKDMPKVSMASYTKESLQNMFNDVRTNKMKKEKYLIVRRRMDGRKSTCDVFQDVFNDAV